MQIITTNGTTYDVDWILDTETRNGEQQLTIKMPGDINLEDIMANLVGAEQIISVKENGVRTVYEGYTQMDHIIYSQNRKKLRLTLEKG